MLERVKIAHFKSLADVDVTLSKSNIIVGPNGSGKSNLVDCFAFIKEAAENDLDSATTKRHGVESIRQWSKFRPYNMSFEMTFKSSKGNGSYRLALSSAKGTFKISEETGNWNGIGLQLTRDNTIDSASFHRDEEGNVTFITDGDISEYLKAIRIQAGELFISQASAPLSTIFSVIFGELANEVSALSIYSIYPNTIRLPQIVSKSQTLDQDGSNLAAIIKRLNSGKKRNKERLLESLRVVLPIVSDIQIRSAGGFYVPLIRVREPNGEQHDLNMSQISDGTLRMLGLLTAFYQPDAPSCIALEEPEQMIHPGLLPVLRDAAIDYLDMVSDSQCIITSHSPNFIDLFAPEDIISVVFKNGVSEVGRVSPRQMELIKSQLFSPGELLVSEGFAS